MKNVGYPDRYFRLVFAALLAGYFYSGAIHGTAAVALWILVVGFIASAVAGFCPVYQAMGFSTRKQERA